MGCGSFIDGDHFVCFTFIYKQVLLGMNSNSGNNNDSFQSTSPLMNGNNRPDTPSAPLEVETEQAQSEVEPTGDDFRQVCTDTLKTLETLTHTILALRSVIPRYHHPFHDTTTFRADTISKLNIALGLVTTGSLQLIQLEQMCGEALDLDVDVLNLIDFQSLDLSSQSKNSTTDDGQVKVKNPRADEADISLSLEWTIAKQEQIRLAKRFKEVCDQFTQCQKEIDHLAKAKPPRPDKTRRLGAEQRSQQGGAGERKPAVSRRDRFLQQHKQKKMEERQQQQSLAASEVASVETSDHIVIDVAAEPEDQPNQPSRKLPSSNRVAIASTFGIVSLFALAIAAFAALK